MKVPQQLSDPISENLQKLANLFPSAVKDGMLDVEALREELGDFAEVQPGDEKYELNWVGKQAAKKRTFEPLLGKTLALKDDGKNSDTTQNLYIEGDNLEALKLLRQNYYGEVKMIYIDPPYNTGKDFVYTDKFKVSEDLSEAEEGSISETGERYVKNEKSSNRFHARWLDMMYPRLRLAKDLLHKDGVIFISIDDNEVHNLIEICNEVFGEGNQINPIIHNKLNSKNDTENVQRNHEYVICYRKTTTYITKDKVKASLEQRSWEKTQVFEEQGNYYILKDPITTRGEGGTLNKRPNLGYTVYYKPETGDFIGIQDYDLNLAETSNNEAEVYTDNPELLKQGYVKIRPPKVRGKLGAWTWELNKFNDSKIEILIKKTSNGYSVRKRLFVDKVNVISEGEKFFIIHEKITNSRSILDYSTNDGSTQLSEVFNVDGLFSNPKNINLLEYLIGLIPDKEYTFLDFFSGSAASIHALLSKNSKDLGKRKFISGPTSVQNRF